MNVRGIVENEVTTGVFLQHQMCFSVFLCAPWTSADDTHHECALQQDFLHRVRDVTMFGKALHLLL